MSNPIRFLLLLTTLTFVACGDDEPALIGVEQLAKACVVTAACSVEARPSVSSCVENYFDTSVRRGEGGLFGEMYRCAVAAGGNCDAIRRCFGAGDSCTREAFKARCDGNTAVECDLIDHRVYRRRCGDVGLTCRVDASHAFAADCVCDSSYGRRCAAGMALRCEGSQVVSDDCQAKGLRCSEGRCVGASPQPCPLLTPPRCEDRVAISCVNKQLLRLDCAQLVLAGTCRDGACVPLGNACGDDFNRCSADGKLQACINGAWQAFDCVALGLEPCKAAAYGANCGEPLATR